LGGKRRKKNERARHKKNSKLLDVLPFIGSGAAQGVKPPCKAPPATGPIKCKSKLLSWGRARLKKKLSRREREIETKEGDTKRRES